MTGARNARERITRRALKLGFDAIGFAPATLGDEVGRRLGQFLAKGHHGDMGWMETTAQRRTSPHALWHPARSAVVVAQSYAPAESPLPLTQVKDRGVVSVYARNRDYHDVIKGRLKELAALITGPLQGDARVFVDTAPIMEKPLAVLAGIGWQGKHTNLVSRQFGSWLFLGEILTTLDLGSAAAEHDHCGSCTRCLDICPTQAFPAPYQLDARRCVSYLTIEHKGPVDPMLRPGLGNRVFGCDDCLAICPWNKFARATREEAFWPRPELTAPELADLAALDDAGFRQVFAGSPVKRIGRSRLVRNALYAIGNSGMAWLEPVAARLRLDEDVVIAEAAHWAVGQLRGKQPEMSPSEGR